MRTERDQEKSNKRKTWYSKGGYESVIFVPATPLSQLQKSFQNEIDRSDIRIRVVEKAGNSIKSMFQRSDPFKRIICGRQDCLVCENGGRGSCGQMGINYELQCKVCGNKYIGETSKNAYTRGKEHISDLERKLESSIMLKHCQKVHGGRKEEFVMNVLGTYKNDTMLRQIYEAVRIDNVGTDELINSKTEWNYVQLPRVVLNTQ